MFGFARRQSQLFALLIVIALGACANPNVSVSPSSGDVLDSSRRANTSGNAYLYAAVKNGTEIVSYPSGHRVATINSWGPLCIDPNNGNVYISTGSQLREYAPGTTTPIASVTFSSGLNGNACAVDSTTGDIAIVMFDNGSQSYSLSVYQTLGTSPQSYSNPNMKQYSFCGYDGQGNLFLDGRGTNEALLFSELPKNSSTFTDIAINEQLPNFPGSVQWDGTYITLETFKRPTIYRISVSGSAGIVEGTVSIRNTSKGANQPLAFTWIQGNTVVASHGGPKNHNVGLWHYPAGGKSYQVIKGLTHGKKDSVSYVAISEM